VADSRKPTFIATLSNCVVLVGGEGRLATVVSDAALSASGAHTFLAELASAATVCAEERPYAIVIPDDIYDFGGSEFDALAKDLGAGLVIVPSGIRTQVLTAMICEEATRLG